MGCTESREEAAGDDVALLASPVDNVPASTRFSALFGEEFALRHLRRADTVFSGDVPKAQPWDSGRFVLKKKLQDARRNHGVVNLMADRKAGDNMVAVKCMPLAWSRKHAASFAKVHPSSSEWPWVDIAIMAFLNQERCTFACEFHGVFLDSSHLYVVTSLATGGDLYEWAKHLPHGPGAAREATLQPVMRQLALALRTLHNFGICHHDVSLENVLVHHDARGSLSIKLIDFGMAALTRNNHGRVSGKPSYQAPETHHGDCACDGFLLDVFAYGVVVFSLALQDYPWLCTKPGACKHFDLAKEQGIAKWLASRRFPDLDSQTAADILSGSVKGLLVAVLDFDQSRRFTLGENAWQRPKQSLEFEGRESVWALSWLNRTHAQEIAWDESQQQQQQQEEWNVFENMRGINDKEKGEVESDASTASTSSICDR